MQNTSGEITRTLADFRLIFDSALKTAAPDIIKFHNQPTDNLKVSIRDRETTLKFRVAGDV